MADSKISQLTSMTNPTAQDVLPVVDTSLNATKKITIPNFFAIASSFFRVKDASDATKKVAIDVSGVTTGTTRTLAVPDANTTIVGTDATQTLTNKTISTGTKINTSGSDGTGAIYYRDASGDLTKLAIGSAGQILDVSSGGIPEWIPNPAASDASTTVKGVTEIATTAEVNAGTGTGGTGAKLVISPDTLAASTPAFDGSLLTNLSALSLSQIAGILNTINTYTGGYYTYVTPLATYHDGSVYRLAGWVTNTAPSSDDGVGGFYYVTIGAAGSPYLYSTLPAFNSTSSTGLEFADIGSKAISIKTRVAFVDSGDTFLAFGFSSMAAVTAIAVDKADTTYDSARFFYDSSSNKLYSVTSKAGVGATSNEITGITIANANIYQIDFTSSAINFYVNGVLKFSHTTNIPNGTTKVRIAFGGLFNTSGTCSMVITNPLVTLPITAS